MSLKVVVPSLPVVWDGVLAPPLSVTVAPESSTFVSPGKTTARLTVTVRVPDSIKPWHVLPFQIVPNAQLAVAELAASC